MFLQLGTQAPAPALVTRLELARGPDAPSLGNPAQPQIAISADGRTIAFATRRPGTGGGRIFVRPLDEQQAAEMPGTRDENRAVYNPVFSPDGAWIAYRTRQEVFKVPMSGGRPTSLGLLENVFVSPGLSWSEDDWIYYAESVGQTGSGGLFRVHASGGEPERVVPIEGATVGWPQAIGDGRFVLFSSTVPGSGTGWDGARIMLLDTQTRSTRVLVEAGGARPMVTASGHLLFVRGGNLLAASFDQDRLQVSGTPRQVLDGIQYDLSSGTAQYAIAGSGTLVYQSGLPPGTSLLWADVRGALQAFPDEHVYYDPRLSPDGRAVAVEVLGEGDDIWVLDLGRATQTKLSLGADEDETPAWSPDGAWVAWSTNRDGQRVILRRRADGSGPEDTLWSGPEHVHVSMYAPDGQWLLFEKQTVETSTDIWLVSLDGSGTERLVVGSAFNEYDARLSPDGRWLAYTSDESGISQVYVQPFPDLDARFPISTSGGSEAVWARDGRRLFYRSDTTMWAVSVEPGETFEAGVPEPLFEDRYARKAASHTGYDVGRDGRFLVIGDDSPQNETMTVILNWTEELKRLVPTE